MLARTPSPGTLPSTMTSRLLRLQPGGSCPGTAWSPPTGATGLRAHTSGSKRLCPNETSQTDFTHYCLATGRDVEVLNFLDDHSRLLLACAAFHRVTGPAVTTTFKETVDTYGIPASVLLTMGWSSPLGSLAVVVAATTASRPNSTV